MAQGNMIFAAACKKFFGMKDGQSLGDFVAEVKAVQGAARVELARLLTEALHSTGDLSADAVVVAE